MKITGRRHSFWSFNDEKSDWEFSTSHIKVITAKLLYIETQGTGINGSISEVRNKPYTFICIDCSRAIDRCSIKLEVRNTEVLL